MLLKHLYDFAVSRDLLDDPAFRRNQPVRWIIHLDRTGKLLGKGPQQTEGPRKNKGHEYDVPKTSRATNSGTVADFLVDDIGAIFCLSGNPSEQRNERAVQSSPQSTQTTGGRSSLLARPRVIYVWMLFLLFALH